MKWLGVLTCVALVIAACTSPLPEVVSTTESPTTVSAGSSTSATISVTPSTATTPSTTAVPTTKAPDSTLIVEYDQDGFYTEGSVLHLELYRYFPDSDSFPTPIEVIDREAPPTGTILLDVTKAPGIYELRSYQRPCNGSCEVLESPSDGCAARLTLEAGSSAKAVLTVRPGSGCRLDVDGATLDVPERSMDLTQQPIGAPGCQPVSPYDANALTEVLATSTGGVAAWGLLWERPPLSVNRQIKMAFRLTGTGEFNVVARHDDGTEIVPNWGPNNHGTDSSSYGRPGNEWGMAFTFPSEGCWNIHFTRGDDSADVWVQVGGSSEA